MRETQHFGLRLKCAYRPTQLHEYTAVLHCDRIKAVYSAHLYEFATEPVKVATGSLRIALWLPRQLYEAGFMPVRK